MLTSKMPDRFKAEIDPLQGEDRSRLDVAVERGKNGKDQRSFAFTRTFAPGHVRIACSARAGADGVRQRRGQPVVA